MATLTVELVHPLRARQALEATRTDGGDLRSLVVCPTKPGSGTVPAGKPDDPGIADLANLTTFEILPGHQPLCSTLPPGTTLYAVYSRDELPKAEASHQPNAPTVLTSGGVLHVRTNLTETIVTIILLGE
jgi:hypothetical protein